MNLGRRRTPAWTGALAALLLLLPLTLQGQGAPVAVGGPTLEELSASGPHAVINYTDFPGVPEFAGGTIYYPVDAPGPIGGIAIAPGFTEEQRHIEWWGPRLASHGYAVLLLDTNAPGDSPELRADALMAAVAILRGEHTRPGSPLAGRVDGSKMAVAGHSMGGGGALLAAHRHSDQLRAVIPFTPWQPDPEFSGVSVPTLILAGSADRVAPPGVHAFPHFQALPDTTPRVYLEIAGGDHFISDSNRGTELDMLGRYAVAWLKLYMDGDERYRRFLYEERIEADQNKLSRYLQNP